MDNIHSCYAMNCNKERFVPFRSSSGNQNFSSNVPKSITISNQNNSNYVRPLSILLNMSEIIPKFSFQTDNKNVTMEQAIRYKSTMERMIPPDYFYHIFSRKRGRPSLSEKDSCVNNTLKSKDSKSVFQQQQSKNHTKKSLTSKIARERRKDWENTLLDNYSALYIQVKEKEVKLQKLQTQIYLLKCLLTGSKDQSNYSKF